MAHVHRFFLLLCGMALLLPAWAGDKVTSAEQAIVRAQTFLKAVGWTSTAKPVATFPVSESLPNAWGVEYPLRSDFDETISLRIEHATGQITGAFNFRALHQLPEGDKVTITQEQATTVAERVLAQAGISMESLQLVRSEKECHTAPPQDLRWTVGYRRMYAGYEVMNDFVQVSLHPLDGSLISLKASLRSPMPKSVKVMKKESDAKQIAEKYLVEQGRDIQRIESATLMIVQPNNYYERPTDQEKVTRLAWVIHCIRKNATLKRLDGTEFIPSDEHFDDVWVDAETGKVLGGMACS